jgi:hypothetical protein
MCIVPIVVALNRFVARDEGFYLYGARLITEGYLPYRDFFLPQTPGAALFYGGLFMVVGIGWVQARVCAALLTAMAGVLLYFYASKRYGQKVGALYGVVFLVSVGVQVWLPTAQAGALGVVFLIASLVAHISYGRSFCAGVLFSCAVATRLTLLPAGVVFLLVTPQGQEFWRWRHIRHFLVGVALGALPWVALALIDPENAWHHNITYHQQRSILSDLQTAQNRWVVLKTVLGLRLGAGTGGFQLPILFYSSIIALFVQIKQRERLDPLLFVALLLFVVHLLPEPTYLQYFSSLSILMLPAVAHLWSETIQEIAARLPNLVFVGRVAVMALVAAFSLCGARDLLRFVSTGEGVIGVGHVNRNSWTLRSVSEVARVVDEGAAEGGAVIVTWPGYLVTSRRHVVAGLENHFGPQWAKTAGMEPVLQDRRRIRSWARAVEVFKEGAAPTAVLFTGEGRSTDEERDIQIAGGRLVWRRGGVKVYQKPTGG